MQTLAAKPIAPSTSDAGLLLQRKCACGSATSSLTGACEECKSKRPQSRLRIGASNHPLEQEADRVADQVVGEAAYPEDRRLAPHIQRPSGQSNGQMRTAPAGVGQVLASSGSPLDSRLREDMEQRFGHDFSQVRVHVGAAAVQSAHDANAQAYTVRHSVAFGADRFNPRTHEGRRLLAHELTHVVQQTGASARLSHSAPAILRRQTANYDEQSSAQAQASGASPGREQVSRDLCVAEPIDNTKWKCQFSPRQLRTVRIVTEHALRRCARSIAAINMPGNESEVASMAMDYFNLNVTMSEKTKRFFVKAITAVRSKLEHSPIECGTCQDEHCNSGAIAHVDAVRTLVVLCPQFFNSEINKVYSAPRFLIHEAAHLARLDRESTAREELYCHQGATRENKCPVVDAIHNVDAWSHFIEALAVTI